MPTIRFIEHSGREHAVDAKTGQSVMQAAVDNMVPGIIADCGGTCSCATCQAYIDEPWLSKLPAMEEGEDGMLDGSSHRKENSRLSCQIVVTEELDGLVVRLPISQY